MPVYTIEAANRGNSNVLFLPTQTKLRGRWTAANVAHKDKSEGMKALSRIEFIPGRCVSIDTDKREGRIFDPLEASPEGRQIWQESKAVMRSIPMEFGNAEFTLEQTQTFDRMTVDDVKTWLFYMAQLVESKQARIAEGSPPLPKQSDVRLMPGRRLADPLCPYVLDEKYKWADCVPEDGAANGESTKKRVGRPPLALAGSPQGDSE